MAAITIELEAMTLEYEVTWQMHEHTPQITDTELIEIKLPREDKSVFSAGFLAQLDKMLNYYIPELIEKEMYPEIYRIESVKDEGEDYSE
jgi:hypothetical protein